MEYKGIVIYIQKEKFPYFIELLQNKKYVDNLNSIYVPHINVVTQLNKQGYIFFRLNEKRVFWASEDSAYKHLKHYTFEEFLKNINNF